MFYNRANVVLRVAAQRNAEHHAFHQMSKALSEYFVLCLYQTSERRLCRLLTAVAGIPFVVT